METVRNVFDRVVSHVGNHVFTTEQLSQPLVELNIDSVELLEIFGMMEEELGILLSEEELSGMATLNQLLELVGSKVV
jgi:acyl carrier protein